MMTKLRNFLLSFIWLVPFLSFIAGYQLVRLLTHTETVFVPSVVGLHLNDAIRMLSADQLNVRILAEKEDPDLHEGMILSQTPDHGQMVKPHQSVFLVITRKPLKPQAPKLQGITCAQAQKKARHAHIRLKSFNLESSVPKDRVITQSVAPGREVKTNTLTIYCSDGSTTLRIFPELKGKSVDEVVSFFGLYDIPVKVHGPKDASIKDQRPLAGTLIDIQKPLIVEITTSKK